MLDSGFSVQILGSEGIPVSPPTLSQWDIRSAKQLGPEPIEPSSSRYSAPYRRARPPITQRKSSSPENSHISLRSLGSAPHDQEQAGSV